MTGNIGPRGAARRRRMGWGLLVAALALSGAAILTGTRAMALATFSLFWGALLGLFQAREKT
jgi:hypothetical protein